MNLREGTRCCLRGTWRALAATCLALAPVAARAETDPPTALPVEPSQYANSTHVDGAFVLNTVFLDTSPLVNCEVTLDGNSWSFATLLTPTSPATCQANPTCSDGQALTLNMRATDSFGNTGTATAISRTCDAAPPVTTDNAPSAWQANDATVTLSASDSVSGVLDTRYCTDSTNACGPINNGNSVPVTCAAGSVCQTYVRYHSRDNVLNIEAIKSALVRIDKAAPTGGSISYPNGVTQSPISISFVNGSDGSGSGLGTRTIERSQATLQGNSCQTFGAWTAVFTNPASSPVSDSVANKTCNKYRYLVQDQVGNLTTYTSPNIANVK